MQRLSAILIAAAILSLCGCQKEVKEIRHPDDERPSLLVSAE